MRDRVDAGARHPAGRIATICALAALCMGGSARAQRPATDGDWGLRRGATRTALLSLHATGSQLTMRDSTGVHAYPVRLVGVSQQTRLLVTRPNGTDSMVVHPYGRRTLFVDVRRAGRVVGRQVYVRLTPAELARYEAELRRRPPTR